MQIVIVIVQYDKNNGAVSRSFDVAKLYGSSPSHLPPPSLSEEEDRGGDERTVVGINEM